MSSKKTDYVNAQFDDAEARIQALVEEILSNVGVEEVPVWITTHNGGSWANRFAMTVIVYKKQKTYLKMFATYLPYEDRSGGNYWSVNAPEWARPPINIDYSIGGLNMFWYPDGNPNHGNWDMGSTISDDATRSVISYEYSW